MLEIREFYKKRIVPFIDKLISQTSVEDLFEEEKNLFSQLDYYIGNCIKNSVDLMYLFCSTLALKSVFELFCLVEKSVENKNLLIHKTKEIGLDMLSPEFFAKTDQLKNTSDNDKKFDTFVDVISKTNSSLFDSLISDIKMYITIFPKVKDSELTTKASDYMNRVLQMIIEDLQVIDGENLEEKLKDCKSRIKYIIDRYNRIHFFPNTFSEKVFPLYRLIELYSDEDNFLRTIDNTLLQQCFLEMTMSKNTNVELSLENCVFIMKLFNRFCFIAPYIKEIFRLVLNSFNDKNDIKEIELNYRIAKSVVNADPDFFKKYPGITFYIYKAIKIMDYNTLARSFACTEANIYPEELDIFAKVCEHLKCDNSPTKIFSLINKEMFYKSLADDTYQVMANQELLCQFIYYAFLDFLSKEQNINPEIIQILKNVIINKEFTDFSALSEILNIFSEWLKFNKQNPFEELLFTKNENSRFTSNLVALNILFMLCHSSSIDVIYHEVNFVREQQKEKLNCVPKRNFKYEKNEADEEIRKVKANKKILKEIDFGFPVDYLQKTEVFKMAGIDKGITRKMTCKLFAETDKIFENIHKYKKGNKYKIDYEENYRITNRNRLSNYYLYLDRNSYTHHSDDLAVNIILDDMRPKNELFDAIDEICGFIARSLKETEDEQEKVFYSFFANLFGNAILNLLMKFAPELNVSFENQSEIIDKLFETKKDDYLDTNIYILKKEYLNRAADFSLEQNLSERDIHFLKETINFAFLTDKDFISENKFPIVIYLMYMTIKLNKN